MLARICAVLVCLSLAACDHIQVADTAQLPPFFYGPLIDNDTGAINEAAWALGAPSRTQGNPVQALRAAVAVEYLAGQLNTLAPRWSRVSPVTKMQMVQARAEFRQALGIRPDAPAQAVVNAQIWAIGALQHNDPAGVMQALSSPVFTQPPQQTMQVLNNLPPLPAARAATAAAERQQFRSG